MLSSIVVRHGLATVPQFMQDMLINYVVSVTMPPEGTWADCRAVHAGEGLAPEEFAAVEDRVVAAHFSDDDLAKVQRQVCLCG